MTARLWVVSLERTKRLCGTLCERAPTAESVKEAERNLCFGEPCLLLPEQPGKHRAAPATPAGGLPGEQSEALHLPGIQLQSPPRAACLASLGARARADYPTWNLHGAARGAAGSPASSLRSWPSFSSFMVVVASMRCNTEPPHQPAESLP